VSSQTVLMSSQQQIWTSSVGSVERRNYNNNEIMSGIIAPTTAGSVTLRFTFFDTEVGYDFVTIKSCTAIDCQQSTELGKYSGSTIPGPLTSNTGILLIEWKSDVIVTASGWSASWMSSTVAGMVFEKVELSRQPVLEVIGLP
jgi:hypothetical protein